MIKKLTTKVEKIALYVTMGNSRTSFSETKKQHMHPYCKSGQLLFVIRLTRVEINLSDILKITKLTASRSFDADDAYWRRNKNKPEL